MLCHPHVIVDGQDVSDGAAVDVLEVVIAPLGKDQPVALLLKKEEQLCKTFSFESFPAWLRTAAKQ